MRKCLISTVSVLALLCGTALAQQSSPEVGNESPSGGHNYRELLTPNEPASGGAGDTASTDMEGQNSTRSGGDPAAGVLPPGEPAHDAARESMIERERPSSVYRGNSTPSGQDSAAGVLQPGEIRPE